MTINSDGYRVTCNGCSYMPGASWVSPDDARRCLEAVGWVCKSVTDYCRECVKEGKHLGDNRERSQQAATADQTPAEAPVGPV